MSCVHKDTVVDGICPELVQYLSSTSIANNCWRPHCGPRRNEIQETHTLPTMRRPTGEFDSIEMFDSLDEHKVQ